MKRSLTCAAWFLAALVAAPVGAQMEANDTEGNLSVRAYSPWPQGVASGYVPVTLEIENLDEERGCVVDVDLTNRSWTGAASRVLDAAVLEPGATVVHELLLPCTNTRSNDWRVELRSTRAERVEFRFAGYGGQPDVRRFSVIVAVPPDTPPIDTAPWVEAIKTADLEATHSLPQIVRRHGSIQVQTSTTTSGDPVPNVKLVTVPFGELPARHEAYSSLDAVIVDVGGGLPSESALTPLLEWVRQGGTLVLSGRAASELASTHPALAAWMEERFARFGPSASATQAYYVALGTLLLVDAPELFSDEVGNELVRRALSEPTSWVPGLARQSNSAHLELPGFEELPFTGLTFFLMVFAVLIGPVNFTIARKLGRTHLTLITIPAVSLFACISLMGYAFLSQGIDAKLARHTWTILDQRNHRVATAEQRLFWAGLSPGAGLRAGAGSSLYPAHDPDASRNSAQPEYRLDARDGLLLAGEYLPTRKPTEQVVLTDRAARGRLAFERAGQTWNVRNGLGAELEELIVRDAEGGYWSLDAPLAPDGVGSLAAAGRDDCETRLAHASDGVAILGAADRLPPATYAGRLRTTPFGDECGIEWNELAGDHRLYGILSPAEVQP